MFREEFGLKRYANNPIINPKDFPGAQAIYNCGQTMYKGKTILLVAVRVRNNPMPRVHIAESDDGVNFTIRPNPFIQKSTLPHIAPLDNWPIDIRVTYFADEDVYYIMRPGNSAHGCVAFLGKTKDFETYEDIEVIALPNNRVPCLFPEKIDNCYVRLDRPYSLHNDLFSEQYGHIWVSYSPDLIHWGRHRVLLAPWQHWNTTKIGPTPPIKTKDGWLEIIHGVSGASCSGVRYNLGVVLLDLKDPTKIIGKANSYILTPETEYELTGEVPNVVFACGAIADHEQDRLRVYYGGADTCIALATASISELIDICKKGL